MKTRGVRRRRRDYAPLIAGQPAAFRDDARKCELLANRASEDAICFVSFSTSEEPCLSVGQGFFFERGSNQAGADGL